MSDTNLHCSTEYRRMRVEIRLLLVLSLHIPFQDRIFVVNSPPGCSNHSW
jgi:hypothetical protein